MNFRLIGAAAVAIAIGALGYAAGVSGRADVVTDAHATETDAPVADALSDGQRAEVEALIASHLISNPEIIAAALTELQAREAQAEMSAQIDAIAAHAEMLFASDKDVVLGNPDGDVTLVEFFDYNCSFCRRALADVRALIENDPDLRVVLKEFPVLGEASVQAAQVSVAVAEVAPEMAKEFHFALLEERGQVNGALAMTIAEDLGIDVAAVQAAVDSESVNDVINDVYMVAGELNLTGTPTFVTRSEVVVGAVGIDQLRSRIAALRADGPATDSNDG